MSTAPPGSSWRRRAAAGPRDADSTRGARFRELVRGRGVAYGAVLGVAAALVAGAALHSVAVLAGGPPLAVAGVLGLALVTADRRSAEDFFASYAASRGMGYVGQLVPLPLTPLLGAGDTRRCEHWMEGPLGEDDGSPEQGGLTKAALANAGFGHFRFDVHEHDHDGRGRTRETRHFTICQVDIEAGIRFFPGIFLRRRGGLLGFVDGKDWLSRHNRHEVELESARLCERCDLLVDDGQDELLLRQLFAPSLEVLLAEHPLGPCFEYRAGTLVVYVERRLEDEGSLDLLREAAAGIARRIADEAADQAARHAA